VGGTTLTVSGAFAGDTTNGGKALFGGVKYASEMMFLGVLAELQRSRATAPPPCSKYSILIETGVP